MNRAAKHLLCLVNSRSGGNKGMEIARTLNKLSLSSFDKITVRLLDQLQSLPSLEEIEKEYSTVLIAGGDGTLSSVLGNYSGTKIDFLLLPLGTGNDLARELGIQKIWRGNLQEFINKSLSFPLRSIKVWQASFNSPSESPKKSKFLNYISFGWDGLVVERFEVFRKGGTFPSGRFGTWGNRFLFLIAGIRHPFYTLPSISIEADGKEILFANRTRTIIFSNICSVMGLGRTNTLSKYSDDLLEMCIIKGALGYLKMLLPTSIGNLLAEPTQAKRFTLKIPEGKINLPVQIDGEFFGQTAAGSVEIESIGTVLVRCSST